MKPILKYIALLIIGGVLIPLYQYTGAVKTAPVISTTKADVIDNLVKREGYYHFSPMQDAAAKLLPVLNLFKQ